MVMCVRREERQRDAKRGFVYPGPPLRALHPCSASNATLELRRGLLARVVAEPGVKLGQRTCGIFLILH